MSIPITTLAMLVVLVLPAAAQPLRPALKQAQCPVGYMQSGGYCTPISRMPAAIPKSGQMPKRAGVEHMPYRPRR